MAKRIEELLRQIYDNADRDDILTDAKLFLRRLQAGYNESYRSDCRLLEKAARAGFGNVVRQYLKHNRMPTGKESDRLCSQLMTRAGISRDEARRAVYLYSAMVGWETYRTPSRPSPQPAAPWPAPARPAGRKKWRWYDIVGLILLIHGALGYVLLYGSARYAGVPAYLFDSFTQLGVLRGMPAEDIIVITLIRSRLAFLAAGALMIGIPRLVQYIRNTNG